MTNEQDEREPINIIMRYKAERSTIAEAAAEIRAYGEQAHNKGFALGSGDEGAYQRKIAGLVRESEQLRALLLEGRQWAEVMHSVYMGRNRGMAPQVHTYLKKLEPIFPRDPLAPVEEAAPADEPIQPLFPAGFILVAQCVGCGVHDEPGATHFSECPAYPGALVRPAVKSR